MPKVDPKKLTEPEAWKLLGSGRDWWASPHDKKYRPTSPVGAWILAQVLYGDPETEDLTGAGDALAGACKSGLVEVAEDNGDSRVP
jgi:hypothetical protein